MIEHKLLDRLPKQQLRIAARLIAGDEWQFQFVQDGTDVLVFQFDRTLAARSKLLAKLGIELRFRVLLPRSLQPQHLEIGSDRGLHFLSGPILANAHHLKAQALQFGDDSCLAAGKIAGLERPLVRNW
ncbi:hypothetical protein [Variovorax sp. DT-64]|uniref:hypothetical protein n=1 Tax=Variovorax sp. DT-64 TaxID=3396160 RepID=UPI003F5411A6